MTKILVFGGSTTYGYYDGEEGGWVDRLKRYLIQKVILSGFEYPYTVFNLGITGDTTEDILKRFEAECKPRIKDIIEYKEKIAIVFQVGLNDSQFIRDKKKLKIPLKKFEKNIEKLIKIANQFTEKIAFIEIIPVDESRVDPTPWNTKISYKNEYIKAYNGVIKSVCKLNEIPFIEIFDEWIKFNYKVLLEDGAHLNADGHRKMFETVKNFLFKNKII